MKKKILFVVSSTSVIGPKKRRTGNLLPEVAHPYEVFKKEGYEIDVYSVKGGEAPIEVKEGKMQEVLQLLTSLHIQTRAEEGNLFYTICQDNTHPDTLLLSEGYTSAAAQQAHVTSDHYKKLAAGGIIPLLDEREVFLTTPIIK